PARAERREAHVCPPHASPAAWDAVAAGRRPDHPLLASMGREVEALQQRLAAAAPDAVHHLHPAPPPPPPPLGQLRWALAAARLPPPAERELLAADDAGLV